MAIDDARRDVHSFSVDNHRAARRFQSRSDRRDFSAGHEQVGVLQCALCRRSPNRRALNQNGFWLLRRSRASERSRRIGFRKIQRLIERRRFLVRFLRGRRVSGGPFRVPTKIR